MSRLIKMKIKIKVAFILCLAASTMVACRASVGIVRTGVFQTPAAKALDPSERAVMEQPYWLESGLTGINVELEDADSRSNDKWYKDYPGLVKPARIEVAPGKHRFNFLGGHSWLECYFELTMLPGHVYKPTWFSRYYDDCGDCRRCGCFLEVTDTAPDGKRLPITVNCSK
jgi:hypothetical protein